MAFLSCIFLFLNGEMSSNCFIFFLGFQWHRELRDSSPLTHIVLSSYRRGRQRGPGGLISALISLNKFRVCNLNIKSKFKYIFEVF